MAENYKFSVEKKGYSPSEVDKAIEELTDKNSYLKARVNELEQKLDAARRLIRRFSETENGLRQNIADSKRAAAEMLRDTKERSDTLLDKARESCGEMISDLDLKIADRMNTVDVIRAEVTSFKNQLFSMYSSHIDMIETIAATAENFVYEPDYTKVAEAVDEFEAAGEPHAEAPEFEEYPQESIFKDFVADEKKEFVFNESEKDEFSSANPFDVPEDFVSEKADEDNAEPETIEFNPALDMNAPAQEDLPAEETFEDTDFYDPDEDFLEAFTDADTLADLERVMSEEVQEAEQDTDNGASAADVEESLADDGYSEEEQPDGSGFGGNVSDDEYYKFLADFINEDDGTMSEPGE